MGSHDPLWSKKGQESNHQFDSRPLKVRNRPNFLACRWRATYQWNFQKDLQFCFKHHLDRRFACKVMGPKFVRIRTMGISRLPFGSPKTKCHLDVGPWPTTKYIIRWKVVASPKFGLWWVLWIQVCPWLNLAPKVLNLCTNQLIVWFVQVSVSDWFSCHSS
jgi:hypothetical protein